MTTHSPHGVSQYVLLPAVGVRARPGPERRLFSSLTRNYEVTGPVEMSLVWPARRASSEMPEVVTGRVAEPESGSRVVPMQVLDAVHEDAPKLVEVSDEAALMLREAPGLGRLAPVRDYPLADVGVSSALPLAPPPGGGPATTVQVRGRPTGAPIAGAEVVALTDRKARLGDHGLTDANGEVRLTLGAPPVHLEQLYIDPPQSGYWGCFQKSIPVTSPYAVDIEAVDLTFAAFPDALRHFYGAATAGNDGAGVRVAVVDTGIDVTHPDLVVRWGHNTVVGELPVDYGDNGLGHGTHVAGIIAAQGAPPTGVAGLAPGAELVSFRVYGAGQRTAKNYAILKALIYAGDQNCQLINMSLGSTPPDEAIRDAVDDATDRGALVICAAGNGNRQPVAVPACYGVAVAALGRRGTFPAGAREEADIEGPAGGDPDDFVARFSNIGLDVDFIAPGVGIISTVPGGHSPGRGTSMAAAAASGMAARLLSAQPQLLQMPADGARSAAMQNHLNKQARRMGFGLRFEGYGML